MKNQEIDLKETKIQKLIRKFDEQLAELLKSDLQAVKVKTVSFK